MKKVSILFVFAVLLQTVCAVFAEDAAVKEQKQKPVVNENSSRPNYKQAKLVPVLTITSNYASARFLAERARADRKVPYILLPVPGSKDKIVFMPAQKGNLIQLEPQDLSKFIAVLRPRRVVFLGNENVVNPVYRTAVPKQIPTFAISESNWSVAARIFADVAGYPELYQIYQDEYRKPVPKEAAAPVEKK